MKSKNNCSTKTRTLLKEVMEQQTKEAVKWIHELAEEARKKKLQNAG
jgi:parvulin-like peptidyl-prolyl isomerase